MRDRDMHTMVGCGVGCLGLLWYGTILAVAVGVAVWLWRNLL